MTGPEDTVRMLREMIRSSRPHSGSEEAHDAWDEAIDRAYAALDELVAERDRLLAKSANDEDEINFRKEERDRFSTWFEDATRSLEVAEAERDRIRACVDLLPEKWARQFWHNYRTHPALDDRGQA